MENGLEHLEKFTEREKELFARALNTLLAGSFVLRQIEKDRPLYRFIISHFDLIENYLSYMNWYLKKDETLGVITCGGPPKGRLNFNLEETLGLLTLRVLYEEKQMEISLSHETTAFQYEILEKYKVLTERDLNKTRYLLILRRFKSLKLVQIKGEESDPEAIIILYPSIVFTLDMETLTHVYERIEELTDKETSEDNDVNPE